MKKVLATITLTLCSALGLFAQQAPPDLKGFKEVGLSDGVAYYARDLKGYDTLTFELLAAEAEIDYVNHRILLNPDSYSIFKMSVGCKEFSYQVLSELGMQGGKVVKVDKPEPKSIAKPNTDIHEIIKALCPKPTTNLSAQP